MASGINFTLMETLTCGYSPCPNDTYIFYALANRLVQNGGLVFTPVIEDVETLNKRAVEGREKLDVTKMSFHAFGHAMGNYDLLSVGSAIGRGCGPLLVTTHGQTLRSLKGKKVAIPGRYTTAAFLLQLFEKEELALDLEVVIMPFHEIMDAVKNGVAQCGLVIHEGRFTYHLYGLAEVLDLGSWWERATNMPMPLGGIFAKKSIAPDDINNINQSIADSLEYSRQNEKSALQYIKQHSQELEHSVIMSHINLYVNEFTRNLGKEGMAAIETFITKGQNSGIF